MNESPRQNDIIKGKELIEIARNEYYHQGNVTKQIFRYFGKETTRKKQCKAIKKQTVIFLQGDLINPIICNVNCTATAEDLIPIIKEKQNVINIGIKFMFVGKFLPIKQLLLFYGISPKIVNNITVNIKELYHLNATKGLKVSALNEIQREVFALQKELSKTKRKRIPRTNSTNTSIMRRDLLMSMKTIRTTTMSNQERISALNEINGRRLMAYMEDNDITTQTKPSNQAKRIAMFKPQKKIRFQKVYLDESSTTSSIVIPDASTPKPNVLESLRLMNINLIPITITGDSEIELQEMEIENEEPNEHRIETDHT